MEARDFGSTVTLYMPQPRSGPEPYVVLQERRSVGTFASRDDAMGFARSLAASIRERQKVAVRMRIEDEAGEWTTCDPLDP